MKKENKTTQTESHAPLSGVSASTVNLRDFYAAEAMKAFMLANGRHPQMTIIDRIKFWAGKNGWKRCFHYNYENISEEAFKMADLMLKNRD